MKFFNFKGNIFSKFNIVDIFAILLLIFLLPALYYSFNMYKVYRYEMGTEKNFGTIDIREFFVLFSDVPESQFSLIREGDRMLDKNGLFDSQLIKIHRVKKTERGNQLYATMRFKIKVYNKVLSYNDKQVVHKTPFVFTMPAYALEGMILNMNPIDYGDALSLKWIIFRCKIDFLNIPKKLFNTISEGDVEVKPDGEIMARLIHVISKKPRPFKKLEIFSGKSENFEYDVAYFPEQEEFYDITAWMLLKGKIIEDRQRYVFGFKKIPIVIGAPVEFYTLNYAIQGTVLDILPYDKEDIP